MIFSREFSEQEDVCSDRYWTPVVLIMQCLLQSMGGRRVFNLRSYEPVIANPQHNMASHALQCCTVDCWTADCWFETRYRRISRFVLRRAHDCTVVFFFFFLTDIAMWGRIIHYSAFRCRHGSPSVLPSFPCWLACLLADARVHAISRPLAGEESVARASIWAWIWIGPTEDRMISLCFTSFAGDQLWVPAVRTTFYDPSVDQCCLCAVFELALLLLHFVELAVWSLRIEKQAIGGGRREVEESRASEVGGRVDGSTVVERSIDWCGGVLRDENGCCLWSMDFIARRGWWRKEGLEFHCFICCSGKAFSSPYYSPIHWGLWGTAVSFLCFGLLLLLWRKEERACAAEPIEVSGCCTAPPSRSLHCRVSTEFCYPWGPWKCLLSSTAVALPCSYS